MFTNKKHVFGQVHIQTNGLIATKLAHDGPRWACIQGVLKFEVKGRDMGWHFCDFTKQEAQLLLGWPIVLSQS